MSSISTASMNVSRGPRHSRSGPQRGGIQKRQSSAARTDRDGDLDMNGTRPSGSRGRGQGRGRARGRRGQTNNDPRGSRGRGRGGNPHGMQNGPNRTNGPQASRSDLRQLAIRGWQQSSAASNQDGGRQSLIDWIIKKARANPPLEIFKVCLKPPLDGHHFQRHACATSGRTSVRVSLLQQRSRAPRLVLPCVG